MINDKNYDKAFVRAYSCTCGHTDRQYKTKYIVNESYLILIRKRHYTHHII